MYIKCKSVQYAMNKPKKINLKTHDHYKTQFYKDINKKMKDEHTVPIMKYFKQKTNQQSAKILSDGLISDSTK